LVALKPPFKNWQMKKDKMIIAVVFLLCLVVVVVWRFWPSADQLRDVVIDWYIKIFCER